LGVLETNLSLPGHRFWPDSISVLDAVKSTEGRITEHRQITDAYLVGLAIHHRGKLATMDRGIAAWGVAGGVDLIG
jgi:predicted nucleic acid-binding protein